MVKEILETYPPHFEGKSLKFIYHFGHHFPDIDIILEEKKYGLELKSTQKGGYKINGGSVIESTSEIGYEEIFLFLEHYLQKRIITIKYDLSRIGKQSKE